MEIFLWGALQKVKPRPTQEVHGLGLLRPAPQAWQELSPSPNLRKEVITGRGSGPLHHF